MGKRGPAPGSPQRGGNLAQYKPTPGDFYRHLAHVHLGVWSVRSCKVCRLSLHNGKEYVNRQWDIPEGVNQEHRLNRGA